MNVTIRPFHLENDLAAMLDIVNPYYLEPVTQEMWLADLKEEEAQNNIVEMSVATDRDGKIVGYSHIKREYGDWDRGRLRVWVITSPDARKHGVGTLLYNTAMEHAVAQEANKIDSTVRDDDAESLRFTEKRGFHIDRHMFGSRLDVEAFDETPFVDAIAEAEATGIRFFSMADLEDTEENRRKLYELNKYIDSEVPGEREFPTFEGLSKMVFESDWYRPDGQIIAADGDRWVGMSAVGNFPESNSMEVMITGVDTRYRGRKIGMALKLLTHRCARRYGVKHLDTGNDSHNAPMLAINERLGYKKMRGTYHLMKVLNEAATDAE